MVYLSSVRNCRHDGGKRRKFFRSFVRQVLFARRVPVLSGDERKKPFKAVCVSARRSSGEEREQGRKQGRSGLFFRPGTRASCHRKKRVFPPDMSRTNRFGPGRHVLHPMSSIRSAGPGRQPLKYFGSDGRRRRKVGLRTRYPAVGGSMAAEKRRGRSRLPPGCVLRRFRGKPAGPVSAFPIPCAECPRGRPLGSDSRSCAAVRP